MVSALVVVHRLVEGGRCLDDSESADGARGVALDAVGRGRGPGVGPVRETLHRWLRDPAFRAELDRNREEAFRMAPCQIMAKAERAVGTLTELLRYGSPRVQLKAAKTALDLAFAADMALRDRRAG